MRAAVHSRDCSSNPRAVTPAFLEQTWAQVYSYLSGLWDWDIFPKYQLVNVSVKDEWIGYVCSATTINQFEQQRVLSCRQQSGYERQRWRPGECGTNPTGLKTLLPPGAANNSAQHGERLLQRWCTCSEVKRCEMCKIDGQITTTVEENPEDFRSALKMWARWYDHKHWAPLGCGC
jgi:hypothetical protein